MQGDGMDQMTSENWIRSPVGAIEQGWKESAQAGLNQRASDSANEACLRSRSHIIKKQKTSRLAPGG